MAELSYAVQIKHIYNKNRVCSLNENNIVIIGILGNRGVDYNTLISVLNINFYDYLNENLWQYLVNDEKHVVRNSIEEDGDLCIRTITIPTEVIKPLQLAMCFRYETRVSKFDDSIMANFLESTGIYSEMLRHSIQALNIYDELLLVHSKDRSLDSDKKRKQFVEDVVYLYDIFKVYPQLKGFCQDYIQGTLNKEIIKTQLGVDSFYYNVNPTVFTHECVFDEYTTYGTKSNKIRQRKGSSIILSPVSIGAEKTIKRPEFEECGFVVETNKYSFTDPISIAYTTEESSYNWDLLYSTLTKQQNVIQQIETSTDLYVNEVLATDSVKKWVFDMLNINLGNKLDSLSDIDSLSSLLIEDWDVKFPNKILAKFRETGLLFGEITDGIVQQAVTKMTKYMLMKPTSRVDDLTVEMDDEWNIAKVNLIMKDAIDGVHRINGYII